MLNKKYSVYFTHEKTIIEEKFTKPIISCSRSLLETIQGIRELTLMILKLLIFKTERLFNINFLHNITIKNTLSTFIYIMQTLIASY